jgi:RNA polymerase sigma factor (sigma-70 family)
MRAAGARTRERVEEGFTVERDVHLDGGGGTAQAPTADDDASLARTLQGGDPVGAEGLFRRYGQHIHDFVQRVVHDPATSEDITQTTFVRAIERSGELRDPRRVRSWLYSIALNLARDHLTKNPDRSQIDIPESVASADADPVEATSRHATESMVRAAVASMEPVQRTVLDLAMRHDLSTREIAATLGETTARASLQLTRARSSFRHAFRSLVVAQSRTHCDRLAAMVPPGVAQLTPRERRSVEHHMKHCAVCQGRAAVLTSPLELLGGIALLPLPATLGHDSLRHVPMAPAHPTAAHLGWLARLRTPTALAGGGLTLLLFGGGVAILHATQQPVHVASAPRRPAVLPVTDGSAFTFVPTPSSTPFPTPTPTPSGARDWADAQSLMRNAHGYHVTYGELSAAPAQAPPGQPVHFDLTVQPNGDFTGTYFANDGFIGQFDLRRDGGVLSVRHLNLGGNFGIPGAPETATQFFGLTYDQASALGDSWLPLTGAAQRPAAGVIAAAVGPYVSAAQFADVVLVSPADINVDSGLEPGSTLLRSGTRSLTYRATPDPFIDYSTSGFDVRADSISP